MSDLTPGLTITISPWPEMILHRYPQQTSPQPCYVELDLRDGEVRADWSGEIGSGVPAEVWHGVILRWRVAPLTQKAGDALLAKLSPLLERVRAGGEVVWDGSNKVGRLTNDAREADEKITDLCEQAGGHGREWAWLDASDWLDGGDGGLDLSADTTDEHLAELAEQLESEAAGQLIVLERAQRHLERLREELRESAPAEA